MTMLWMSEYFLNIHLLGFFLEYIQQTQILCDSSEDLGTWLAHRVMLSNSMCKAYYFWTESSSMDFFGIIG